MKKLCTCENCNECSNHRIIYWNKHWLFFSVKLHYCVKLKLFSKNINDLFNVCPLEDWT